VTFTPEDVLSSTEWWGKASLSPYIAGVEVTAQARAMALLLNHLNERQLESFRRHRAFDVVSDHGEKFRIVYTHPSSSVRQVMANGDQRARCWYPRWYGHYVRGGGYLPLPDVLLGQKLALETGLYRKVRRP
jgi:hypothetical protein